MHPELQKLEHFYEEQYNRVLAGEITQDEATYALENAVAIDGSGAEWTISADSVDVFFLRAEPGYEPERADPNQFIASQLPVVPFNPNSIPQPMHSGQQRSSSQEAVRRAPTRSSQSDDNQEYTNAPPSRVKKSKKKRISGANILSKLLVILLLPIKLLRSKFKKVAFPLIMILLVLFLITKKPSSDNTTGDPLVTVPGVPVTIYVPGVAPVISAAPVTVPETTLPIVVPTQKQLDAMTTTIFSGTTSRINTLLRDSQDNKKLLLAAFGAKRAGFIIGISNLQGTSAGVTVTLEVGTDTEVFTSWTLGLVLEGKAWRIDSVRLN